MKKKIYTDCLGKELKEGNLIAIGSSKSIYMIMEYWGRYFLHPINEQNRLKSYENLMKDMLENEPISLDAIYSNEKNIYKLHVWCEPSEEEKKKEEKILEICREQQRALNIKNTNKKKERKEKIKRKTQEFFEKYIKK